MIRKCDLCNFMFPTELIYWNVSEDINYCSKCLKIKLEKENKNGKSVESV